METRERCYKIHYDEMTSTKDISNYCDDEIERILENLLKALPNAGLLYKYKAIVDDESFHHVFDPLENGSIYLPEATKMDDPTDVTLLYGNDEIKEAKEYLSTHYILLIKWAIKHYNPEITNIFSDKQYNELFSFYDATYGRIKEYDAISYLCKTIQINIEEAAYLIRELNNIITKYIETKTSKIDTIINSFSSINSNEYKSMFKLYCLTEKYDDEFMWDKYAKNHGVCIEYDYNIVKKQSIDIKRLMISLYRVNYGYKPKHSFLKVVKHMIGDKLSEEEYENANRNATVSYFTKPNSYSNEKEWRIILNINYHEILCNMVSKIFISESLIGTEYYIKIKSLADYYGWDLIIRKINKTKNGYIYDKTT